MKLTREELMRKHREIFGRDTDLEKDSNDLADWILSQWPDEQDGQFIRVPPENEWPEWADHINVSFRNSSHSERILTIGRYWEAGK